MQVRISTKQVRIGTSKVRKSTKIEKKTGKIICQHCRKQISKSNKSKHEKICKQKIEKINKQKEERNELERKLQELAEEKERIENEKKILAQKNKEISQKYEMSEKEKKELQEDFNEFMKDVITKGIGNTIIQNNDNRKINYYYIVSNFQDAYNYDDLTYNASIAFSPKESFLCESSPYQ